MTKPQQEASRELNLAMAKFLVAYGWKSLNSSYTYWTHPKLGNLAHDTHDAYMATRAQKSLGW